ncbi:olfactory receptor-like protein OLF4 [Rhinophrynus dorsalis]
MENQTIVSEFVLLGLSDLTDIQLPLFLVFLLLYLMTLTVNLLIILLVYTDFHLKTPMYFFLGNLSFLDICASSVTAPHLLINVFRERRSIAYSNCIAQVFFFISFACTESFLLAVMSYDRYVAICHPLHYSTIINTSLCAQLVTVVWVIGPCYSLVHTLCLLRLSFCDSKTIKGLFCELYQLIQLSCSNNLVNNLLVYVFAVGVCLCAFLITFISYLHIFNSIFHINIKRGQLKAFSTCASHLTVVFIFYGTSVSNYVHADNKEFTASRLSVIYAVITPMLNPIIYCLRNNEFKGAFQRLFIKMRTIQIIK